MGTLCFIPACKSSVRCPKCCIHLSVLLLQQSCPLSPAASAAYLSSDLAASLEGRISKATFSAMDHICFWVLVSFSKAGEVVLLKGLRPKILIRYCKELARFEELLAKTKS